MKVLYIALFTACVATSSLAQDQMVKARSNDKAAQQVVAFRNRYIEAEENKDVAYLDKILTDNFRAVNPQGQLLDKAHQLDNIKRTDRIFKVLNPRETQVYFYNNGNVAILFEHVTVDGEDRGRGWTCGGRVSICSALCKAKRELACRVGTRDTSYTFVFCGALATNCKVTAKEVRLSPPPTLFFATALRCGSNATARGAT